MPAAAFQATVHGFRTVPSRGVVSITIEAPIEQHAEIAKIALHGAWVAVARLQDPKVEPAKEKRNWADLQPSAQAAMRCGEPLFVTFLKETWPAVWREHAGDVAEFVRSHCVVESRKDLNTNQTARVLWHQLDEQFQAWTKADVA